MSWLHRWRGAAALVAWIGVLIGDLPAWAGPAAPTPVARVVVLPGPELTLGHETPLLQRTVRERINRPDASFYPAIDLYQAGRRRPPGAEHQTIVVEEGTLAPLLSEVDRVLGRPYDAWPAATWHKESVALRQRLPSLWFVDRPGLRPPLFRLYAAIGYAAENSNQTSPPFYDTVGGRTVNYYWYLAGALASQEPDLLAQIGHPEVRDAVERYQRQVLEGVIPSLRLSLEDRFGSFDAQGFSERFTLLINGLATSVSDPGGIVEVPLGRLDVHLKRADGHGLAERLEVDRLVDQVYFLRQNAWKTMGSDLRDQLMSFPQACTPPVEQASLGDLSIYAQLHPTQEVYVAAPGDATGRRVHVWRWDSRTSALNRIAEPAPVQALRWVVLAGTGVSFSTYAPQPVAPGALNAAGLDQDAVLGTLLPERMPALDGMPWDVQLRAHLGHGFIGGGTQVTVGEAGSTSFVDAYPVEPGVVVSQADRLALRQRAVRQVTYGLVGGILGSRAPRGQGLRGFLRAGWSTIPQAIELTAHGGWTYAVVDLSARHQLLVDVDAYTGVSFPTRRSLFAGYPMAQAGFTGGMGVTF